MLSIESSTFHSRLNSTPRLVMATQWSKLWAALEPRGRMQLEACRAAGRWAGGRAWGGHRVVPWACMGMLCTAASAGLSERKPSASGAATCCDEELEEAGTGDAATMLAAGEGLGTAVAPVLPPVLPLELLEEPLLLLLLLLDNEEEPPVVLELLLLLLLAAAEARSTLILPSVVCICGVPLLLLGPAASHTNVVAPEAK